MAAASTSRINPASANRQPANSIWLAMSDGATASRANPALIAGNALPHRKQHRVARAKTELRVVNRLEDMAAL